MQPDKRIPADRPVGIFGAGMMGEQHLEAWHALRIPIAGIYARNLERARALAARYQVPAYDSVSALLSEVEIADICLPTFLHREVAEEAARGGCQIVCEKPLALRYDDAEAIFRACDEAKVRLFVAMVLRFVPAYRAVAEKVRSGVLGGIEELSLKRTVTTPSQDRSWFADESLSGGAMLDLLIHDIDYALWLAGDVQRVHATLERDARNQYARLVFEHTSGATSRIEGGWVESAPGLSASLRVVCSGGALEISQEPLPPPSEIRENDPYVEQLRHFMTCLETDAPFEVTRGEVLRTLRVILAAQESAKLGKPVSLPPDKVSPETESLETESPETESSTSRKSS